MRARRDFKQFPVGSTELDGAAGNTELSYHCRKAYDWERARISTGQTDLRAGVKLSTSLFILFFDDSIFADVNPILCANHLPDVKSVTNLLSNNNYWYIS